MTRWERTKVIANNVYKGTKRALVGGGAIVGGLLVNEGKKVAVKYVKKQFSSKRTLKIGRQLPSPGGESRSYCNINNKRPKLGPSTKMLGLQSINRSTGFSRASTQGVQSATNIGSAFNITDVQNMFTDIGDTATAQNGAKLYAISSKQTMYLTNSETTNNHFIIFDCLAKKDGSALNTEPASVFLAGCVDANGGAAADATVPGTMPSSNPRFKACYTIKQRTHVVLTPGQTHIHTVNYGINKLINNERVILEDVVAGPLAGLTLWTFIIQHGTPIHGVGALTTVTLGATKIDIVVLEEIKFKALNFNYNFNSISTTLVTNLTGEQVGQQTETVLLDQGL